MLVLNYTIFSPIMMWIFEKLHILTDAVIHICNTRVEKHIEYTFYLNIEKTISNKSQKNSYTDV